MPCLSYWQVLEHIDDLSLAVLEGQDGGGPARLVRNVPPSTLKDQLEAINQKIYLFLVVELFSVTETDRPSTSYFHFLFALIRPKIVGKAVINGRKD